jgi:hypothetical protein
MYMDNKLGLVTDDQGNQVLYHSWSTVRAVIKHINDGKSWGTCPLKVSREEFGYILQWELDNQQERYDT